MRDVNEHDPLSIRRPGGGKLDQALKFYTQTLRIKNKHYGEDTFQTSDVLYNLGLLYSKLGRLEESIKYF
jgi:tetratricopeptide (TPR) repeat protein